MTKILPPQKHEHFLGLLRMCNVREMIEIWPAPSRGMGSLWLFCFRLVFRLFWSLFESSLLQTSWIRALYS
jgi:hypothetical protein